MPSVCFTGRGEVDGAFVQRNTLEAMAQAMGWTIHDKVRSDTDYLIASRQDTSKAKAAREFGTKVMPYGWFHQAYCKIAEDIDGNVTGQTGAPVRTAVPVDFTAMEEHEAWGLF